MNKLFKGQISFRAVFSKCAQARYYHGILVATGISCKPHLLNNTSVLTNILQFHSDSWLFQQCILYLEWMVYTQSVCTNINSIQASIGKAQNWRCPLHNFYWWDALLLSEVLSATTSSSWAKNSSIWSCVYSMQWVFSNSILVYGIWTCKFQPDLSVP